MTEAHKLVIQAEARAVALGNRPFDGQAATNLVQSVVDLAAIVKGILVHLEGPA